AVGSNQHVLEFASVVRIVAGDALHATIGELDASIGLYRRRWSILRIGRRESNSDGVPAQPDGAKLRGSELAGEAQGMRRTEHVTRDDAIMAGKTQQRGTVQLYVE